MASARSLAYSLQVEDWVYRDEGHANIVVASRLVRGYFSLRMPKKCSKFDLFYNSNLTVGSAVARCPAASEM